MVISENLVVLKKTLIWGFVWPLLILLTTFSSMDSISESVVLIGSAPGFVTCYIFQSDKLCDWRIPYYVIPSLFVISMPYFWYLLKQKEMKYLYWGASIYSLICALLGGLAIIGKGA